MASDHLRTAVVMDRSNGTGLPVLAGIVVLFGLYVASLYNYLLFHSLVEIFSVVVTFVVFLLAWNTRRVQDNFYVLFVGLASISGAALELVHTFAYKGFGVFAGDDANLPTQLWIAFRYVSSTTFLVAPLMMTRRFSPNAVFAISATVAALLLWLIFSGRFPDCYIEGSGLTRFKIASEYVIILIYMAALVLLIRKRHAFDRGVLRLLVYSLAASIASETFFTQYVSVYGTANIVGHLFLLISVYCVYRAIVVTGVVEPARLLFRSLKKSEEALRASEDALLRAYDDLDVKVRERTAELMRANAELESEIGGRVRAEAHAVHLAAAVEAAAEAIVLADGEGTIQYVNAAFERTTGYPRSEVVGCSLGMLDSGTVDSPSFQDLRVHMRSGKEWGGRLIQKRKDGTLYFEDCTMSPVPDQGGAVSTYVFIKRDVTEKIRLESIAESISLTNNIGTVFAGVRHEIGNPINSAGMVLRILTEKLGELPQEKVQHYLRTLAEQVGRVEHILRSLKSYNIYESQEPRNVRLAPVFGNILSFVQQDSAKQGIAMTTRIGAGAEWVHADERALQQVLLNVIMNASDALAGREQPAVSITAAGEDGNVMIQVADNGIGIPSEKIDAIFRPFYTTKRQGTGLGLPIVRKMLAEMRGTVTVASTWGQGTTVTIVLPAGRAEMTDATGGAAR